MGGHRNQYGYHEYRGRGGGRARAVLLFIIALLAVLLAVVVAFSMFVDLEYTDTGVKISWRGVEDNPSPPPIASDPVEVVSSPVGDVTVEPIESVEPTPTPVPEPQYTPIGAVSVTLEQLRGGTAAQAVAAAGGNALVVQMKDVNGRLAWQSQVPLAANLGTNAADNGTAQAVRNLAEAGNLYLVARVQCFRDPVLARNWVGSIMTRGGNVWHDYQGMGWSSPASQQAVDYLSALCLELADMGFDEILLDSAGYPDTGEVKVLAVSDNRPQDLSVPVAAFWQRLSGELAEKGVALSVQTSEEALRGENTLSGVTAANLGLYAARVWVPASVKGTDYAALLTAGGLDNTASRVVVKNSYGPAGSWYR